MSDKTRIDIREVLKSEHQWISLEGVTLVSRLACVCCGSALETVGAVGSATQKIRLGYCPTCGYVGYIDRPTDAWFRDYYNSVWDKKASKTKETIKAFRQSRIIQVARECGLPATSRVFEVGTGYGQLLRQFRDAGFASVFGIEHSPHRAALAASYAGATVYHGDFGHWSEQEEGKAAGTFDLVYSKSVMEHMEDPCLLFQSAARIQREGGWAIIAVPNVLHEPVNITWMFLPHLHAFSAASLVKLAETNGYQAVRVEEDGKGLVLVARKRPTESRADVRPKVPTRAELMSIWWKRWAVGQASAGTERIFWWTINDPNRTGLLPSWMAHGFGLRLVRWMVRTRVGGYVLRACFGVARRFGAMRVRYQPTAREADFDIAMDACRFFIK